MPLSAVASRKILADSMRRLKKIRNGCGKDLDEKQERKSTGDPFLDRVVLFKEKLELFKEAIEIRMAAPTKSSSSDYDIRENNRVRRSMVEAEHELKVLEQFVQRSQMDYDTAVMKKKKEKKQKKRLEVFNRQKGTYDECQRAFEALRAMDDANTSIIDKIVSKKQEKTSRKRMRKAYAALSRANQQHTNVGASSAKAARPPSATHSSEPFAFDTMMSQMDTLETAPETAEQMRLINQQKLMYGQALDRISDGLGRLKAQALAIGAELQTQNVMIEETAEKVDEQAGRIAKVTKQIETVMKEQNKLNLCINIFCFLLLLALVGYLLWRFKVVG